jgi:hypothetical protein
MIMSYLANLEMSYFEVAIIFFKGGYYGRKGRYQDESRGIKEVACNS